MFTSRYVKTYIYTYVYKHVFMKMLTFIYNLYSNLCSLKTLEDWFLIWLGWGLLHSSRHEFGMWSCTKNKKKVSGKLTFFITSFNFKWLGHLPFLALYLDENNCRWDLKMQIVNRTHFERITYIFLRNVFWLGSYRGASL